MRPTLPLILATAIASTSLMACSDEEVVDTTPDRAISFRPAISTRATETTNANLSKIKVAGFMGSSTYFDALDFTKGSDNYFTSTPAYNWPGDDTPLDFYAYAPTTLSGVTLSADTKDLKGYTPDQDISQQVDFITAMGTGKRSVNEAGGLELTFNHQLSQIEIQAKASNDAYTFKISGIRIGQPVASGDFDFSDSKWTLASDKAIYEETYDTPVTLTASPVSVMGSEGNAMLIPQQLVAWDNANDSTNTKAGAYLSVKLQVNTAAGAQVYPFASNAQCQWAAIPINTLWEAGKKYVYTLDLSNGAGYVDPKDPQPGTPVLGGPIKFTVNVLDWNAESEDLPMETNPSSSNS